MAEYNFGLDDVSELQLALSQFTGAQFSQAPSQQQPPLPPLPPGHPPHYQRPPSVSSVGRYSLGMGSRTDSVESVFTSPGHNRVHAPPNPGPRLPPRDYLLSSSGSGTMLISDALNSSAGGYTYARARNSTSTGDLLDSGSSSTSPQMSNRSVMNPFLPPSLLLSIPLSLLFSLPPSLPLSLLLCLPPPLFPSLPPSFPRLSFTPLTTSIPPWYTHRSCVPQPSPGGSPYVISNGYYQQRQVVNKSPQVKTKADGSRARKSSPGSQRKTPLTQSAATTSESRDEVPDLPPRE